MLDQLVNWLQQQTWAEHVCRDARSWRDRVQFYAPVRGVVHRCVAYCYEDDAHFYWWCDVFNPEDDPIAVRSIPALQALIKKEANV